MSGFAIVVLVVAGGCSSVSKAMSHTTTTNNVRPVAQVAPASFAELAREVIPRVPAGFYVQPDNTGDMGPADLVKASRKDTTPNARKVLSDEGFLRGYARLWIGPKRAEIIVIIDQFRSSVGARRDYLQRASANRVHPAPGAHYFVVAGLPADQSLGDTSHSQRFGAVAVIQFTTGVYSVQVLCNGPGSETTMARRVTSLANAQFEWMSS